MLTMASEPSVACAVDFGTTFSGYAWSCSEDPNQVTMNKNWGQNLGYQSFKTATSVLMIDEKFVAFGYEAEDIYDAEMETKEDGSCSNMALFRHFKMVLHQQTNLDKTTTVTATNGVTKPALEVFAYALMYMKEHLISTIQSSTGKPVSHDAIRWVVTVPAIWSENSKKFMRKAAFRAGLIATVGSDALLIALEPECAGIYCRTLPVNMFAVSTEPPTFVSGTKYVIVDAGGGTVDITAHEILSNGNIREIHCAVGGACGGTAVDAAFEDLLTSRIGADVLHRFKTECPQQWLSLRTEFEKAKKSAGPVADDTNDSADVKVDIALTLSLPSALGTIYRDVNNTSLDDDSCTKRTNVEGVEISQGGLYLHRPAIKKMYTRVVDDIVALVQRVLQNPKLYACQYVLLVGGFSQSSILQKAVKDSLRVGVALLVPYDAQVCVLKGAVVFGNTPEVVTSRVARYTYGIRVLATFAYDYHDLSKMVFLEGKAKCRDLFSTIVRQGEEIHRGTVKTEYWWPAYSSQTRSKFAFFALDGQPYSPQYIDDDRVHELEGSFYLSMPDTTGGTKRKIKVNFEFGGTEIKVRAHDVTSGSRAKSKVKYESM